MLVKNLYEMISVVAADATLSFTECSAFLLLRIRIAIVISI